MLNITKHPILGALTLFFYATPLLSLEILDHNMDGSEKKKTGVYKLSDKEKSLLQKWIDTHYEKRARPLIQQTTDKHPILQETLRNGRFIKLSDQTLWEISLEDSSIAQWWITPVEIIISQTSHPDYPYTLTNSLTESCLKAKKIEILPDLKK